MSAHAPPFDPATLADRYQDARSTQRGLANTILASLGQETADAVLESLGFEAGQVMAHADAVSNDAITCIALYDFRPNGKSAVDRFLAKQGMKVSTAQRTVLRAMAKSRPALLRVGARGVYPTVAAHDDLFGRDVIVADLGLSQAATVEPLLLGRLIPIDDFEMLAGGTLLVPPELAEAMAGTFRKAYPEGFAAAYEAMDPGKRSRITRWLTRWALVPTEEALAEITMKGNQVLQ